MLQVSPVNQADYSLFRRYFASCLFCIKYVDINWQTENKVMIAHSSGSADTVILAYSLTERLELGVTRNASRNDSVMADSKKNAIKFTIAHKTINETTKLV